jgi:hypothetical protein
MGRIGANQKKKEKKNPKKGEGGKRHGKAQLTGTASQVFFAFL